MFFTSFVAGLLGSLSPCVYPLIPITLSVVGTRRYKSSFEAFLVSSSYVLGLVFLHTVLGILFASLGVLAGSALQSPWVNVFLALLMLVMALNLFGVFHWNFPQKLSNGLTRISSRGGYAGAFLMGLVAGVLAAPCTGPVLAGILTQIAGRGNLFEGALLMLSYALGMGFPFLVLGTFSSILVKLPRSGPWMNHIKKILGILMIWVSFYYLGLAIQGFRYQPHSQLIVQGQINQAKQQNKEIILDFWANWCVLCHKLDKETLQHPNVQKALANYAVIRVDLTVDSVENRALQASYGVVGLPALVFLTNNRHINGFISPKEFLEILKASTK